MIPFLTTIPHKLVMPMNAVVLNGKFMIRSPITAPGRVNNIPLMINKLSFAFRNWINKMKKMSKMLTPRAMPIGMNTSCIAS